MKLLKKISLWICFLLLSSSYIIFVGLLIDAGAVLMNPNIDTFYFTPYVTAFFLALSGVCFSWSKGDEDENSRKKLSSFGIKSLFIALNFLIHSFLKYSSLDKPRKTLGINYTTFGPTGLLIFSSLPLITCLIILGELIFKLYLRIVLKSFMEYLDTIK